MDKLQEDKTCCCSGKKQENKLYVRFVVICFNKDQVSKIKVLSSTHRPVKWYKIQRVVLPVNFSS